MEVPSWLYKEKALGRVSTTRFGETQKLAAGLTVGTGAMMVGAALASPVLAAAGAKGAEKMMDKIDEMTFDRDLKKVLDVNKDIGKPSDKQIRLAYQSIRTTNPKFSKDPLIAGTLLRQIMQNRVDPYDPKSPARVDLNIASQLSGAAGGSSTELVMRAAGESMGRLPASLITAHSELQAAEAQKQQADRNFAMSMAQFDQKERQFKKTHGLKTREFAETMRKNRTSAVFDEYGTGHGNANKTLKKKGKNVSRSTALDRVRRGKYASAGPLTAFLSRY